MASQELLSVGRQCSHQTCNLVDFLPFKCQHCDDSFCQEHFMDANEAVETHFVRDCAVMTGKAKARSTPVCARARCGKALFAPIRCTVRAPLFSNNSDRASHRFPADHTCVPVANAAKTTTGPTAASRLLDLNTKASAAGGAALKSIKTMASNAQAQASAPRPAAAPKPASAAAAPSKPHLFSKTDRSSYASSPYSATAAPAHTTTPLMLCHRRRRDEIRARTRDPAKRIRTTAHLRVCVTRPLYPPPAALYLSTTHTTTTNYTFNAMIII
ncbi:hypothetical protein B0H14DRAFT_2944947 [Mycena olivaceomarginata]|nr:hypothetical protein B0H14DRAFT_2944947 [Mycena olivaceomarginata]